MIKLRAEFSLALQETKKTAAQCLQVMGENGCQPGKLDLFNYYSRVRWIHDNFKQIKSDSLQLMDFSITERIKKKEVY